MITLTKAEQIFNKLAGKAELTRKMLYSLKRGKQESLLGEGFSQYLRRGKVNIVSSRKAQADIKRIDAMKNSGKYTFKNALEDSAKRLGTKKK